jgi:hypothetical protein
MSMGRFEVAKEWPADNEALQLRNHVAHGGPLQDGAADVMPRGRLSSVGRRGAVWQSRCAPRFRRTLAWGLRRATRNRRGVAPRNGAAPRTPSDARWQRVGPVITPAERRGLLVAAALGDRKR